MESVTFHVSGIPKQKGSVVKMNGVYRPAGTAHSRHMMQEWFDLIQYESRRAMGERQPSKGAIRFMCEFQLPYPSGIRKNQFGWLPHIKRPDVDKLFRLMGDALTGIVWVDDSQVAFSTVNKVYAWNDRPGAFVVIDFLDDDQLQTIAAQQQRVMNVMDSL